MITKISLDNVASFKQPDHLETDKKVNLVYGLNGTGKSTISDLLYKSNDPCFNACKIEGLNNEEVAVYNQTFIQDYFYETDDLRGIFTLSKENKEAEQNIKKADETIKQLEKQKKIKEEKSGEIENKLDSKKNQAINKIWEIKINYSGGDRVLEYCLENLKGKKEKLFNHIISIKKPEQKPDKSIDDIKKEVKAISGENAQKYDLLPIIKIEPEDIEENKIFQKQIVGNKESTVSDIIDWLKNSDWVKEGLNYLLKFPTC